MPAGSGVAAGHRVVVSAAVGTFGGAVGCRDTKGNVYTVDARAATNNLFVCSAHVVNPLGPGDVITLTYPGFSGPSFATVNDYVGISPVAPVDGVFRQGASTSTKLVSVAPALGTTGASVLVAAVASNGTFVPGAGFGSSIGIAGLAQATQTAGAPGSFSTVGTVASGAWRALLVAYRVG
jgi:hypothetical protein